MTATSEVQPLEAKIPSALACPEGDIFSLPTKEDIVNAFNEIAAIPGQLQGKVQEMKAEREKEIAELYKKLEEAETQEERDAIMKQIAEKENYIKTEIEGVIQGQIDDVVKTIEEFVDTLADILSPYWDKDGLNRDWQKEAREAFKELLEEFHTYIPTKIAEIISKIVPISFTVNIMGLSIDIIKLVTSPAYKQELIDQISGKQFDLQIVEKFKEIQKINKQFRGKDKATNVLSFPDKELTKVSNTCIGEILICNDVLEKESKEQNKNMFDHFVHLTVHSMLHMVGYGHDVTNNAILMENKEVKFLSKIGISDPY